MRLPKQALEPRMNEHKEASSEGEMGPNETDPEMLKRDLV